MNRIGSAFIFSISCFTKYNGIILTRGQFALQNWGKDLLETSRRSQLGI